MRRLWWCVVVMGMCACQTAPPIEEKPPCATMDVEDTQQKDLQKAPKESPTPPSTPKSVFAPTETLKQSLFRPWPSVGCLAVNPTGDIAIMVMSSVEDGEMSVSIDAVTVPGVNIDDMPSALLTCEANALPNDNERNTECGRALVEQWAEERDNFRAFFEEHNWGPCSPVKTYPPLGGDSVTGVYRGAVESFWFAHVHVENIVESEGYLEEAFPITPEERGESSCLPSGEAVASLLPPAMVPSDPENDEGCLGISEEGDHALFRINNGSISWSAEHNVHDVVWVGPNPASQDEVKEGLFGTQQMVESLAGCREVPENLKGIHTIEEMKRLWLHIPGQRARWLWTSPLGEFDSASEATVQGVFVNSAATHVYVWTRVEHEGPGEQEWSEEVTWHSLDSLGLSACKE